MEASDSEKLKTGEYRQERRKGLIGRRGMPACNTSDSSW
jgi:hypothetical protein